MQWSEIQKKKIIKDQIGIVREINNILLVSNYSVYKGLGIENNTYG